MKRFLAFLLLVPVLALGQSTSLKDATDKLVVAVEDYQSKQHDVSQTVLTAESVWKSSPSQESATAFIQSVRSFTNGHNKGWYRGQASKVMTALIAAENQK